MAVGKFLSGCWSKGLQEITIKLFKFGLSTQILMKSKTLLSLQWLTPSSLSSMFVTVIVTPCHYDGDKHGSTEFTPEKRLIRCYLVVPTQPVPFKEIWYVCEKMSGSAWLVLFTLSETKQSQVTFEQWWQCECSHRLWYWLDHTCTCSSDVQLY